MQGAKTIEEQRGPGCKEPAGFDWEYAHSDGSKRSRYLYLTRVLDIYRSGLEVPEDVTLMWCDDNYGYMRSQPNELEQARKGGNGLYYHISYWGRPHDYLWLASTSPALIRTELERAYNHQVQQIWIFNVGDIMPADICWSIGLDLAWERNSAQPRKAMSMKV